MRTNTNKKKEKKRITKRGIRIFEVEDGISAFLLLFSLCMSKYACSLELLPHRNNGENANTLQGGTPALNRAILADAERISRLGEVIRTEGLLYQLSSACSLLALLWKEFFFVF